MLPSILVTYATRALGPLDWNQKMKHKGRKDSTKFIKNLCVLWAYFVIFVLKIEPPIIRTQCHSQKALFFGQNSNPLQFFCLLF